MKQVNEYKLSVLVTCYNRKYKTLAFFKSLTEQAGYDDLQIDLYLLDDASTDGTADAVRDAFSQVNIVTGTGSLFWAGGMLTLWKHVIAQGYYDAFLLFNDDVELIDGALQRLLNCYHSSKNKGTILIGSTLSPVSGKISYGGYALYKPDRAAYYLLKPDDTQIIPCQLANANILLVDAETVNKIGVFSDAYTHYLADFDYSLRAYRAGLDVLIAPGYYGYCEDDHGNNWLSGSMPLKKRIQYLYNPKGLAYHEYLAYIKKFFPADYVGAVTKLWLKTLFPFVWDKFKRKGTGV